MKQLIIVISILIISCSTVEDSPRIKIGIPPNDVIEFQKMIISQLSGEQKIETSAGEFVQLQSRWDEQERNITLDYIESLLNYFDLEAYRHHYTMPNSNFAVDLLIEPIRGTNMYTILPSTNDNDEYIVIGAHYDTDGKNFPGAIDNGSGVALITTVLRQVKEIKIRAKNLIVVYFDQEEENISAGSLAFAKFLKTKMYNIHSVHSFDLIGFDGDNNKEVQLEFPNPNPEMEKIYTSHADTLHIPIYSIKANGSDYASFFKEGINAFGISQAYSKGDLSGKKDSPEDKYQIVNFDYLASSTNLAFEVIKDLLND